MTETIEINLNEIPEEAGKIVERDDKRKKLVVESRTKLKQWIMDKIPDDGKKHKIVVGGYMSNCIALQVGRWLPLEDELIYKNHSGLGRKMI